MSDLRLEADVSGFDDVINQYPDEAQEWLNGFTEDLVTRIKLSFGTSPAGDSYTRGGIVHVASQPGYPPNVDIGTLTNSIEWSESGDLETTIEVGAAHGEYLEDGTTHIQPRPFMLPAFNEAGQRFEADAAANFSAEGNS